MSNGNQQYQQQPQSPPGKGMAIAAMVLGICGLALPFFGIWFIGLPAAIVGIILAVISKKKLSSVGAPSGTATAGLVMSIIALAIGTIVTIACVACVGAIGSGLGALGSFY